MTTTTDRKASTTHCGRNAVPAADISQPGVNAVHCTASAVPKPTRRPRRMAREPKAGTGAATATAAALVSSDDGAATRGSSPANEAQRRTKSGAVLALLQRREGATLGQLVEATGWLPHTARAALTGLRKKGHVITSGKENGQSRVYRAEPA